MYLGCQSADFGLQLLLRLVHLLAEPSKGGSHLPGNTEGTEWQWLRGEGLGATAEAGEGEGGSGLTVGPDGCSLRW